MSVTAYTMAASRGLGTHDAVLSEIEQASLLLDLAEAYPDLAKTLAPGKTITLPSHRWPVLPVPSTSEQDKRLPDEIMQHTAELLDDAPQHRVAAASIGAASWWPAAIAAGVLFFLMRMPS